MRALLCILALWALLLVPAAPAQPPAQAQGAGLMFGSCFIPPPLGSSTGPAHLSLVPTAPGEWLVSWQYVGGPSPCGIGPGECLAHGALATGLDVDGCDGASGRVSAVEGCALGPEGAFATGSVTFSYGRIDVTDAPIIGGSFELALLGEAIADAGCA